MESDGTSDHGNCMQWCYNNIYCGGFAISGSKYHFKSYACVNDLRNSSTVDLYIKQGKNIPYFNILINTMMKREFAVQKILQI